MKVPRLATFINNSSRAQKILKGINKNPSVYAAGASFILAAVMRPGLIGCFNFKDKKDKQYSQASSIAAGAIELVSTIAIFLPLNKMIRKSSDELYKSNTFFKNNCQALRQFKSVTNRGIKLAALIPISLARFALVKPIVDILYKRKEK